jgi:hypothetical protein
VILQTVGSTSAKGIVVDDKVATDGTSHTLRYIQQDEIGFGLHNGIIIPFVAGSSITTDRATGNVSSGNVTLVAPDIDPNTGDLLYIENRRPISRSSDQTENIKLIVEF